MKIFLLGFISILILLLFPEDVLASDSFVFDQDKFFLQTSADRVISETVLIRNLTDKQLTFSLSWVGYEKSIKKSIDFAILQQKELAIEPFAIQTIGIRFSSPEDLKPGDYYGSLKVQTDNESKVVNFTLRYLGQLNERIDLENVMLEGKTLLLEFNNTGNITTSVKGKLTVTNFFGQTVLSKNIDQFDLKASDSSRKEFVLTTLIPGPYQVKVERTFGSKATTQTEVSTVWFFNLWAILTVIGSIGTLATGLLLLSKRKYSQEKSSS